MGKTLLHLFDMNRKLMLVNCWYQSDYESDAMWQLYSNSGIAIQTTFGNLKEAVSGSGDRVLIGQVKYIDYEKEGLYFLSGLAPFLFKRLSFEHEKELRAVIWNIPDTNEKDFNNDTIPIEVLDHGKFSKIDLDTLIESIYVSPVAPAWFQTLVTSILKRYGINKPVIHSTLYTIDKIIHTTTKPKEEITVSRELLDHLYRKDSYRINIEMLKAERERSREYDNFLNDLKSMETEIEKVRFGPPPQLEGKEALLHFSEEKRSREQLNDIFNASQFKTLYYITGKVDITLRAIATSQLTEKEKELLQKKIIYFYSENIFHPAFLFTEQFAELGSENPAFDAFTGFTTIMAHLIAELKV